MLIGFLASSEYLKIFPAAGLNEMDASQMPFLPHFVHGTHGGWQRGWVLDLFWHLVLPVVYPDQ